MSPRNAFRNSVFGASKLASAKTPLLKPYYRLHGYCREILLSWRRLLFIKKGGFDECAFYPLVGVKAHLPRAFALFKAHLEIACGRSTLTLVSGVKVHLPKPLFWKPPFASLLSVSNLVA